jgi:XTP/dITP diphosphohydrolase
MGANIAAQSSPGEYPGRLATSDLESSPMRTLLLATTNLDKLKEYRAVLADIDFQLQSLRDVRLDMDVEETGTTFVENAILKAKAYARASDLLSLADDSGLEIDALGGAPGV